MKKLSAFVLAMFASSAGCQVNKTGLLEGTAVSAIDGGARRDAGRPAIDSGAAKDSGLLLRDATATGDASTSGTSAGGASGATVASGGSAGAVASSTGGVLSAGGVVAAGGGAATSAGGVTSAGGAPGGGIVATGGVGSSSGGMLSAGGAVAAGGAASTGGATTVVSSGGSASPDASATADVSSKPDVPSTIPDAAPAVTLVWSDEFDGEADSRADATKWTYVTWPAGQVNNEKQQYTNRTANAFLDGNGNLVIRALRPDGGPYTSARLDTKGKFSFRTGRIEVRAKLPAGLGSAPGIVLVGTTGTWPDSGELALMEQGGQDKSWLYSTAYAGGASGDTGHVRYDFPNATTATTDFHVYSLDWYADGLVFKVDGNNVTSTTYDTTSPFASIPESIVLYVAVGGDLGGTIDGKAFPMDMVVDYVRVYAY